VSKDNSGLISALNSLRKLVRSELLLELFVFYFKLFNSFKALYYSFLRPCLENGIVLWNPSTISDQYKVERIQWKFLKYAAHVQLIFCPWHYSPVLQKLNIFTQADRRGQHICFFLRKLILKRFSTGCQYLCNSL